MKPQLSGGKCQTRESSPACLEVFDLRQGHPPAGRTASVPVGDNANIELGLIHQGQRAVPSHGEHSVRHAADDVPEEAILRCFGAARAPSAC